MFSGNLRVCFKRFPFVLVFFFSISNVVSQPMKTLFIVQLYGANQVNYPGAPRGRGTANLDFDAQAGSLTFEIILTGITEPIDISIFFGGPTDVFGTGQVFSSDAIISLFSTFPKITSPGYLQYHVLGKVPVPIQLMSSIVEDAANYYIQIFTYQYPYGAVRGQLKSDLSSSQTTISNSDPNAWNTFP